MNAVDLAIGEGELVGLIGPNGAGKSTLFNLITGVYRPTAGTVEFLGQPLAARKSHEIAALGIARTFQNIRLFPQLSVFDNVRAAGNLHRGTAAVHALWRGRSFHDDEAAVARRTDELLELFHLRGQRNDEALSLPYGEQRRLEIVRALATQPRLLLLDEPAAGMNSAEKGTWTRLIRQVREQFRLSIVLVEHSMRVVMDLCERIAVLDDGAEDRRGHPGGDPAEPPGDRSAYLGK